MSRATEENKWKQVAQKHKKLHFPKVNPYALDDTTILECAACKVIR